MHQRVISDEMLDLSAVLLGLRLGDLSFMEELPRGRLDELLGARTDRVARLSGVPPETRLIEAANRACKLAVEMPLRLSSAGAVMAPSDAPPSVSGVDQMEAAMAEVNSLLVAPMPTASTSQILGNNECFEPYTSNIYSRRVLRFVNTVLVLTF
jgi:hypothetical protein